MKQNKKILIIIIIVSIILISVLIAGFALGLFEDDSPLYGEFIYLNDDGTNAKIVLEESSVYFENINFNLYEKTVATSAAIEEMKSLGREYTEEELENLRQTYIEQIDFKNYYDQKKHSFDKTLYIEDERQYYYYVYYPDLGEHGIDLCVDLENKTISIGDMIFYHVN